VVPCDVALPCAIQNELDAPDARALLSNGCRYVVEGANMPTTRGALQVFREGGLVFAPGKAANAGGVAISGLEMAQNRACESWSSERVDKSLRGIMASIHEICTAAAERYGRPGDYVLGANVGGFVRVAEAMIDQGAV
jgi:glutamate dehydrogenase (NADP+)